MGDVFAALASADTVRAPTLDELAASLRDAPIDPRARVRTWKVGRDVYEGIKSMCRGLERSSIMAERPVGSVAVEQNPFVPPGMAFGLDKDGRVLVIIGGKRAEAAD